MRPKTRAFIFDIDGTLVDSNELHVDAWDRGFRHFGKEFPREALRAQIGKGSDQYLPEFITPEEIKRFGKELDQYRSQLFRKEYLPRVRPFPKVRELFQRIRDDDKRIMLASSGKEEDTKYYIEDLLKIDDLIEGYTCADAAGPRLLLLTAPFRRPILQIAISSSGHGRRAPRSHPSHPKNPTITPTVSINPCANTGAQRFRPVSKYAAPRMKPATLESRIPAGPL